MIEKATIYDVTKVKIKSEGNIIAQVYFEGKFDEIMDMMKSLVEGKYMLIAPRLAVAPKDVNENGRIISI